MNAPAQSSSPANPHNPALPYFSTEAFESTELDSCSQRYSNTVDLDVDADTLFDVLEDPASWPVWAKGIGRVVWTNDKPYKVGTTRTVTFWGGMEVYEVFTAWDRGRAMAFTFTGTTQLVWSRFGENYDVEPLGPGRCRLTWQVAYVPAAGFARVHFMVRPMMALAFKSYMWGLARYCRKHAAK